MSEVSTLRLYILRALYLLIGVGLCIMIWPGILAPSDNVSHMGGVVRALLGAVALLSLVGVRYPLTMLPVLIFELVWKCIWVAAFGLPLWLNQKLDVNTGETMNDCLVGIVLVVIALPWGYVYRHYLATPGDRWGARPAAVTES